MTTSMHIPSRRAAGFSLIEVLIALVILSVGLLGIASMVGVSLKSKDSSYYRTQATALTYAMLDRMRANRTVAGAGSYDIAPSPATLPAMPSATCFGSAASCSTSDIASLDVNQWKSDLSNLLPGGDGSIKTQTVNQFTQVTITVTWNDQRAAKSLDVGAPSSGTSAAPAASTISFTVTSGL